MKKKAITVTLPSSPSAGDIVAIADYLNTFGSNAVTLCRNSSLINGGSNNASLSTNGQSVTLVYVDGTRGWKTVTDSTSNVTGAPAFISASGGTITTSGDFKIHTFTSSGNFTICSAPTPSNNTVDYLVIGGGGYGSSYQFGSSGGGGAGGFRESHSTPVSGSYTASPLATPTGLSVSAQTYPITVGAGSASGATNGTPSVFSTITSTGGGRGGASGGNACAPYAAAPGGSGGGGDGECNASAGSGNTPPVSPSQGNNGVAGQ